MKIFKLPFLFILSLFMVACGAPDAISIKPGATKNIRSIAIIQLEEAPLRMLNAGSGMAAFGAIGGAAIAAGSSEDKLNKAMQSQKFNFSSQFTSDLRKNLSAAGFSTKVIKVQRPEKYKLMESYSHFNANADAVMDVVVTNIGYVTEHFMLSPHWRPEARVFVKLIDTRTGEVIYQNTMMYGYHNPFMSGDDIDAPEQFQYENEEDVFKAGNVAIVAGLKDASLKMAQHVADNLRK